MNVSVKGMANWIEPILIAAATEPLLREAPAFVVALEVSGRRHLVSVPNGTLMDANGSVSCELSCQTGVMEDLVTGRMSLQRAFVTGVAELQGDPEALFRLSLLFDASQRISEMQR